jgi:O-antigen/teichoic acid export membrane protein
VNLRDKLFADGVYTFALRIAGVAVSAVIGILTARLLGPVGRGIYALPIVDAALVSSAFSGLTTASSYFMLRKDAGRAIVPAILRGVGIAVLLGIPFAVVLAYVEGAPWAAFPAVLSLPGPAVLCALYGYQVGVNRVRGNAWFGFLSSLLYLGSILVAFAVFGPHAISAIFAWVVSGDLFALGGLVWMIRDARRLPAGQVAFGDFLSYAARVAGVSIVSLLNFRADVYIVAAFTAPGILGMYTLAVSAAESLRLATQVTGTVSSPLIGSLKSERDAARLAAHCIRHNVLIALGACAVLWVLAPIAVRHIYGVSFMPMIPAFRILLVGVFASTLGGPMSIYFTVRIGRPQLPLLLAGLSAAICIAVTLMTVKTYGMIGAATGSTLGYFAGQAVAMALFTRIARVPLGEMVLPRRGDLAEYVAASGALLLRIRQVLRDRGSRTRERWNAR